MRSSEESSRKKQSQIKRRPGSSSSPKVLTCGQWSLVQSSALSPSASGSRSAALTSQNFGGERDGVSCLQMVKSIPARAPPRKPGNSFFFFFKKKGGSEKGGKSGAMEAGGEFNKMLKRSSDRTFSFVAASDCPSAVWEQQLHGAVERQGGARTRRGHEHTQQTHTHTDTYTRRGRRGMWKRHTWPIKRVSRFLFFSFGLKK